MGIESNGAGRRRGRDRRVAVIGAGPGGISSAYFLREAGYEDITVFERAGEVGGTWQRNRYPGLACDVWSHVYSFTWNLNPSWTRSYAAQPEILAYMIKTVDDFGLRKYMRLNTGVASARWDDGDATWVLTLDSGEEFVADVLISGQGMFGELKYPDIEGRESFEGVAMHTGAWDESVSLDGKRVGVIGSAASGVQSIPEIAKMCGHLTVFQRSPQWVLPKEDVEHTVEQLEAFLDPDQLLEYHNGIMSFVGPSVPFSNPDINGAAEWIAACAIEVVEDAGSVYKIEDGEVFTLSWSSGGPAAYLGAATRSEVKGHFVAMSVFREAWLPRRLNRFRGQRFFLYHSPEDPVCLIALAEAAKVRLEKEGAEVKWRTYSGGHGWAPGNDHFAVVREALAWMTES